MLGNYDRFQRLGLKKNPFGSLTPEERLDVTVPPPAVSALLRDGFTHVEIIGKRGRGKSTTLNYLVHHLEAEGVRIAYERVERGQHHFTADLRELDAFALDEAQRLSLPERGRLFREMRGKRFLIGTHVSYQYAFIPRRLPLQTLRIGAQTTRDHLAALLTRRLEVFALEETPAITFSESAIDALWMRFRADIRGMESHLYRLFQTLSTPTTLTARILD